MGQIGAEVEAWLSTWTVPLQYVLGAFTGDSGGPDGRPDDPHRVKPGQKNPIRTEKRGNTTRRWTDLDALNTPEHVGHILTNLQRTIPFADPIRKAMVDRRRERAHEANRVHSVKDLKPGDLKPSTV